MNNDFGDYSDYVEAIDFNSVNLEDTVLPPCLDLLGSLDPIVFLADSNKFFCSFHSNSTASISDVAGRESVSVPDSGIDSSSDSSVYISVSLPLFVDLGEGRELNDRMLLTTTLPQLFAPTWLPQSSIIFVQS